MSRVLKQVVVAGTEAGVPGLVHLSLVDFGDGTHSATSLSGTFMFLSSRACEKLDLDHGLTLIEGTALASSYHYGNMDTAFYFVESVVDCCLGASCTGGVTSGVTGETTEEALGFSAHTHGEGFHEV